jgi:hypothetical protein
MAQRNLIIEVDSFSDPLIYEDFHAMAGEGVIGILVKASQGVRWANPAAPRIVGEALAEGLLVGALHHVETSAAPLSEQVAFFLKHLPSGVYELGHVLEVEPDNDTELFTFSQDLDSTLRSLGYLPSGAGLRCTAQVLSTLSGAPWGARWWAGSMSDLVSAKPWAMWIGDGEDEAASGLPGSYVLASTRGLNIGGSAPLVAGEVGTDILVALDPLAEPEQGPHPAHRKGKGAHAVDVPLPAHNDSLSADDDEDTPEGDEAEPSDWRASAAAALSQ